LTDSANPAEGESNGNGISEADYNVAYELDVRQSDSGNQEPETVPRHRRGCQRSRGSKLRHTALFKTATLSITSISLTGTNAADFTQSNTCGAVVLAGANCTNSVVFTPNAKNTRSAMLSIVDNAAGSPQTAALSGTGTFVQLSPASLSFGNQQVVTLTNKSTA
jgi:hypothetical protein